MAAVGTRYDSKSLRSIGFNSIKGCKNINNAKIISWIWRIRAYANTSPIISPKLNYGLSPVPDSLPGAWHLSIFILLSYFLLKLSSPYFY